VNVKISRNSFVRTTTTTPTTATSCVKDEPIKTTPSAKPSVHLKMQFIKERDFKTDGREGGEGMSIKGKKIKEKKEGKKE